MASMRIRLLLLVAACALPACGGGAALQTVSARGYPLGDLTISRGGHRVMAFTVELATDQKSWEHGLMGVKHLASDQGMAFLFGGQVSLGFWMKDTLIPLDIAFADGDGKVVDVQNMVPCTADPCTVYYPAAPYSTALEVGSGVLTHAGVKDGDVIVLHRRAAPSPTPSG